MQTIISCQNWGSNPLSFQKLRFTDFLSLKKLERGWGYTHNQDSVFIGQFRSLA